MEAADPRLHRQVCITKMACNTTTTTRASSANTPHAEDGWRPYPEFPHIELNQYTGQVRNTGTGNLIGSSPRNKRTTFTVKAKCDNGKSVTITRNIARAMLLTFIGPAPTRSHEASHLNHDPSDCRLVNLVWETRSANLSRRVTPPDGAQHHHAKIGLVDAYRIYWFYHSGTLSMGKLATRYRVTKPTIQQLVTGKT
jgi:hypothetical protein